MLPSTASNDAISPGATQGQDGVVRPRWRPNVASKELLRADAWPADSEEMMSPHGTEEGRKEERRGFEASKRSGEEPIRDGIEYVLARPSLLRLAATTLAVLPHRSLWPTTSDRSRQRCFA